MNGCRAFAATAAGGSHTREGKECQDHSRHDKDPLYSAAVVADGHGSEDCFRSAKGARFAAESAIQVIHAFVYSEREERKKPSLPFFPAQYRPFDERDFERRLREVVVKGIVGSWYSKVNADIEVYPFTPEELAGASEKYRARYAKREALHHAYGTTLIAAAVTPDYWFGIHIGDGRFTVFNRDGSFCQPVPWDERCFLNATTSICDDDAIPSARLFCRPVTAETPAPAAIFLCSDGVDDNFSVENNARDLAQKVYTPIVQTFAAEGFESTCAQIKDLCAKFAANGKADDTSLAGLINMDAVQKAVERGLNPEG